MGYVRKTKDVYEIQGYYASNIGWECVTEEETYKDAKQMLKDYEEHEPQYAHRIVKRRVKIEK